MSTRRVRAEMTGDAERGGFMISVAAELAHMHPQTLRIYEPRGPASPLPASRIRAPSLTPAGMLTL